MSDPLDPTLSRAYGAVRHARGRHAGLLGHQSAERLVRLAVHRRGRHTYENGAGPLTDDLVTRERVAGAGPVARSEVVLLEVAPLEDHLARARARPPALEDGLPAAHLARLAQQVLEAGAENRPARCTALQASDRVHEP